MKSADIARFSAPPSCQLLSSLGLPLPFGCGRPHLLYGLAV